MLFAHIHYSFTFSLCVFLSLCLSLLANCPSVSVCMYVSPSICPSVYPFLSVYPSTHSFCLSNYLSVFLFIYLIIYACFSLNHWRHCTFLPQIHQWEFPKNTDFLLHNHNTVAFCTPVQELHSTCFFNGWRKGDNYLLTGACWMPGIAPRHFPYIRHSVF